MRPYSLDLRERVAAAVDHHEGSIRQIARIFRVSTSFVVRLFQRRRAAGSLEPEPHGAAPRRPSVPPIANASRNWSESNPTPRSSS